MSNGMDGLDRWIQDGNRNHCERCGGYWWDVDGPQCPDCVCVECGSQPDDEHEGDLYCSECNDARLDALCEVCADEPSELEHNGCRMCQDCYQTTLEILEMAKPEKQLATVDERR